MGKRFGIQFKITMSAIVCFLIGMLIILLTLFFYLRSAFDSVTRDSFQELGGKYGNMVKEQFEGPVSFLSGVCSIAEAQMKTGNTDREALQQYIFRAYDNYPLSEGSAFMLEPNVYDGLDSEYVGTNYGTVHTGRISYYYWRENGQTHYLPQTEDDEQEFVQPYYVTSKERKVPTFSEPYNYEVAGSVFPMITASYPMLNDAGNVLGIMTVDLYLQSISDTMGAEIIYDTGYLVLISEEGSILYCPEPELVGMNAAEHGYLYRQPAAGQTMEISTVRSAINGKKSIAATIPVDLELADSRFYISVVAPENEAHAVYTRLLTIIVALIVVVGAAIAVAISRMVGRTIRPLKTMVRFLGQVGDTGNLRFTESEWREIRTGAERGDEIGESLAAFTRMLEQFVYYGDCLQAVAARDLTVQINTLSEQDTCGTALREMVNSLGAMLRDIHRAASQVAAGAVQIDQASQSLASGTSEQASAIDHFTASITEVRGMAEESADVACDTLEGVQKSEQKMDNCTQAMEQMLGAMQDIDQKSQSISRVIKVIDDIAFQTNILALNAAVEAARAGQHGKGFAVVADEVRNLASKSAEAANETAALIEQSLSSVSEGSGIVARVSENLQDVGEISANNAASIRRLSEASTRQRASIESVTTSIQQLAAVVQANSATAEETASSAEEMSAQAAQLNTVIDRFQLEKSTAAPARETDPQEHATNGFSL